MKAANHRRTEGAEGAEGPLDAWPSLPNFLSPRPKRLGANGCRNRCPALFIPCCSKEDVVMTTYDFSPLYRSTVGFDRLFDMLDQSARGDAAPNWPPYNIERT